MEPNMSASDPVSSPLNHKKTLRFKKLIDKSLQLRLVGAFVAVGCVATLFQVVLLNQSMLGVSRGLATNGDILLAETPRILIRSVLITLGLLVPTMTLIGILVTHRIAGPAYRMRMYLKEIEMSGEVKQPCRIRKHDELQDMCTLLNQAVDRIRQDHQGSTDQVGDSNLDEAPSLSPSESAEETTRQAS